MLKTEKLDAYRKMTLWINEVTENFFDELSAENIFLCGVLEILDGRHSEIGTSNMAEHLSFTVCRRCLS